jgi:DNA-binding beta-propeller fold protein YncE
MGSGTEGEFMQPHGLAFDSRGRLFVADRSNNRIQVLDAETYKTLDTWYQFSRLSGIFIDKNDILYGADSESGSVNPPHGAWKRGIRIGSAKDGKVTAFIPDPTSAGETFSMVDGKAVMKKADGSPGATGTLAAEGVAVDAAGNVYGAEVGPRAVKKYVKN